MGMIFNGQSSWDHGLIITAYPSLNHGAKRAEAYQIAGRNGTFYREEGTFDNYIQTYEVAVREKNRRADLRAADIAAWLMAPGFCRLEDSFEPEFFKMARYAGPLNIEQILGKYGICTFVCIRNSSNSYFIIFTFFIFCTLIYIPITIPFYFISN